MREMNKTLTFEEERWGVAERGLDVILGFGRGF